MSTSDSTCRTVIRAAAAGSLPDRDELARRTWAQSIMAEAALRQRSRAANLGNEALRRVELFRRRFEGGLPIRAIADLWGVNPAGLHHDYAIAHQEFKTALLEVVAFHQPGTPTEGGTGSIEPAEGAFLIFFCFFDSLRAKMAPALILGCQQPEFNQGPQLSDSSLRLALAGPCER
jgi:hypothetical protein